MECERTGDEGWTGDWWVGGPSLVRGGDLVSRGGEGGEWRGFLDCTGEDVGRLMALENPESLCNSRPSLEG